MILRRYTRPNCVTTIELRQWLPAGMIVVLVAWYLVAPSAVVVMGLAALLGLFLAAWWWARAMALQVSGQRHLRFAALQVGDELEESITLENHSSLPVLWAEFDDRSELPGYTIASVRAADAVGTLHWRVRAVCRQRGVFHLGPWELRLGDPFGLFLVRQTYSHRHNLLVYPPLAPLPARLLPHTASLGQQRPLHQPLRADTLNAFTTRAYQPGDTLHRVHWPTTARRDAPFVKVFEPEAASTLWLIPDFDSAAHLGVGDDSTEEMMVILAVSLAEQLLRRHLAVGLLTFTRELCLVAPRAGQPQFWDLLRAITPLHTAPVPLAETLLKAQRLIPARDSILLLTPSLSGDWLTALTSLVRPGGAEALLLDPASFGGVGNAEGFARGLHALGLPARVVQRGEVQAVAGAYGALRRWEFVTVGTGRAVSRQTPRAAESLAALRPEVG